MVNMEAAGIGAGEIAEKALTGRGSLEWIFGENGEKPLGIGP